MRCQHSLVVFLLGLEKSTKQMCKEIEITATEYVKGEKCSPSWLFFYWPFPVLLFQEKLMKTLRCCSAGQEATASLKEAHHSWPTSSALFLSKNTGQRPVRRVYSRHTLPSSSPSGQSVLKSQSLSSGISGPLLQWYWPSSVMFMLGEDAKQRRKK